MGRITSSGYARNDRITREYVSDQVTKAMMFLLYTYIKTTTRPGNATITDQHQAHQVAFVMNKIQRLFFSTNFILLHVSFSVDIYNAPFVAVMFSFCH